jgi:hypothetical protein
VGEARYTSMAGGGGRIDLLEGSQASPALPSDKGSQHVWMASSGWRQGPRGFDFLNHREINEFTKGYQPRTTLRKDETCNLLADSHNILSR